LLEEEECNVNSNVWTKCRALFNDTQNCWKFRASVAEWYWQEKVKALRKKHVSVLLSLPKSHIAWPGMKPGSPRETPVPNRLRH